MSDLPPDATENPAAYFPTSIVNLFASRLQVFMKKHTVLSRPIHYQDPSPSIGVAASDWVPDMDSMQMGQPEPTLNRYMIKIGNLDKSLDENMGRALHSVAAKTIRTILYRDPILRVELPRLREELLGTSEKVVKFHVTRQTYLAARDGSTFLYLATTEVLVETETTLLTPL